MAESWTGPKAEAVFNADRLGYPVYVNGLRCNTKVEAMNAIGRGDETVEVERYDPAEVLIQETSLGAEDGQEGQSGG